MTDRLREIENKVSAIKASIWLNISALNVKEADYLLTLCRKYMEAYAMLREASLQNHDSYWDRTGQHGGGCMVCIIARELRDKADKLLEE